MGLLHAPIILGSQYSSLSGFQRKIYVQRRKKGVKGECSKKEKRKVMNAKKE